MTTYRPRYKANPDENHNIVLDFLKFQCGGFTVAPREVRGGSMAYTANYHGCPVLAIDTSKYGGIFTDWYVEMAAIRSLNNAWIEVKTEEAYRKPQHDMTPGELWLYHNHKSDFFIVATDADVRKCFDYLKGAH